MAVGFSPVGNSAPFVNANGDPLSGGLLYVYLAGSSTPATTYQDDGGTTPNADPIVLNSNGYPASGGNVVEIWLTTGATYLFELKTSAGVTVWTRDDIAPINDVSVSQDQWVAGPTPTYISGTSFSLVGDQTTVFHVGRRLKTTNSGGTRYSTISASAFSSVTTVTVVTDTGALDSGLSAVSYGLVSRVNSGAPDPVWFNADGTIALAADQDDWNPTGLQGTSIINVTVDSTDRVITGIVAPTFPAAANKLLVIRHIGGDGGSLWFRDQSSSSSAGNRFSLPGGQDVYLQDGELIGFVYSSADSYWDCISLPSAQRSILLPVQATTSGTTKDFTIPAGVVAIDVMPVAVSTDGTELVVVQAGDSGGVEATGYTGQTGDLDAGAGGGMATWDTGIVVSTAANASQVIHGLVRLVLMNPATFTWIVAVNTSRSDTAQVNLGSGSFSLDSAMTTIRLTSTGTPDDFDAGSVSVRLWF